MGSSCAHRRPQFCRSGDGYSAAMHRRSLVLPIALAALLTACSASSAASTPPTPSEQSAAPSVSDGLPSGSSVATPSARPSASADAAGSVFQVWQNWALATVRVNGLNVRIAPGESEALVPDVGWFDAGGVVRLNAGEHVLVMGSADAGDGNQWVQIGAQRDPRQNQVAVGWAVAGTLDDPWVEEDNSWCPGAEPSFDVLVGLTGIERVGCYSSIPLTFTAQQATISPDAGLGGVCGPAPVPWLQCDNVNYSYVNRDGGYDWEFLLHFDPATGIAPTRLADAGESARYIITGHFNDPAATSCGPNPSATNEDLALYLSCGTQFVVESLN